jgi:hypothetical protein
VEAVLPFVAFVMSPFLLPVGTEVEDSAWKDSRKTTGVVLEFDDSGKPLALVYFGLDKVRDEDQEKQWVEMYKGHGWKEPSMDDGDASILPKPSRPQ